MCVMSNMLEVYYRGPRDLGREEKISREVARYAGKLTYRDEASIHSEAICLTYEFSSRTTAEEAASLLRSLGEHAEGPCDYGPDA
jgi:hypothetical protein